MFWIHQKLAEVQPYLFHTDTAQKGQATPQCQFCRECNQNHRLDCIWYRARCVANAPKGSLVILDCARCETQFVESIELDDNGFARCYHCGLEGIGLIRAKVVEDWSGTDSAVLNLEELQHMVKARNALKEAVKRMHKRLLEAQQSLARVTAKLQDEETRRREEYRCKQLTRP